MSLQLAAKLGAAGTLVAGVPTTYFVWDKYFSLNEIEKAVLEDENSSWNVNHVSNENKNVKVSATVKKEGSTSVSYNWECTITGESVSTENSSKFLNYLKNKLSVEPEKQTNRKYLVKECSKNRQEVDESKISTHVRAELTIKVDFLEENKIKTYLFEEGSTETSGN